MASRLRVLANIFGSRHPSNAAVSSVSCRSSSSTAPPITRAEDWWSKCRRVKVLDTEMSYYDSEPERGSRSSGQEAVVFLHGNPTSSFLWRNVIPHVEGSRRCLAPDLIGMGRSDKLPIAYRFRDHYRYLSAWFDAVDLPPKVSIVCHDWGSGLGFHWCHMNSGRVRSITHMESIVSTIPDWSLFPDVARKMFQGLRSEAGEEMVLDKNLFVELLLPRAILRELSEEEMEAYREPFRQPGEDRRPTLTWPREIPMEVDGPQDVVAVASAYSDWLATSAAIPKLYVHAEPGFFSRGIRLACGHWPNQQVVTVKGLHFLQEDSPEEIGKAIHKFLSGL